MTSAASLVREARRRARLSQRGLAMLAATSQAAVHRYERGLTSPSMATLERLLDACGFELEMRLRNRESDEPVNEATRRDIEYMLARTPEQRLADLRTSDRLVKSARRVS